MAIALYKKGRTHIVNDLDCTVVIVPNNEDRRVLLEQGDHFDDVEDLYPDLFPKEEKPKRGRKAKSAEDAADVVELAGTEPVASADEDQNPAS